MTTKKKTSKKKAAKAAPEQKVHPFTKWYGEMEGVVVGKTEVDDVATQIPARFVVSSIEDAQRAGQAIQQVAALMKKAHESFDPIVEKAHATWKEALGQRKKILEPLEKMTAVLKRGVADFQAEQRRRAREVEAQRLRAIEEEQKQRRLELEASMSKAQAAATAKQEARVAKAQAQSEPPGPVKIEGLKTTMVWRANVEDVKKLLADGSGGNMAVIAAMKDEKIMERMESLLAATQKAMNGLLVVDGVEFYQEEVVGRTGGRNG